MSTNIYIGNLPFNATAEQIRDLALAASELMNRRLGGPPVSPYQAGGDLWRETNTMSPAYQQSVGRDLHRRSLYSVWKRTTPLPNMLAFDATTVDVSTVLREVATDMDLSESELELRPGVIALAHADLLRHAITRYPFDTVLVAIGMADRLVTAPDEVFLPTAVERHTSGAGS